MYYQINKGVLILLSVEIENILSIVCPIFKTFRLPVVITSGVEGPHREGSLHYKFRAIDIRKKFNDPLQISNWEIHRELILSYLDSRFLLSGFPVAIIDEADHLHIEWKEQ
jgi:hypothetical protein